MKKVIQDLTNILLDEEKINLYSELFGLAKEYIICTRTKLLIDLTNYYIDLNYQKNVTDFKGIAFDNETFKFDDKYKLSYVELIYIRFYIK